MTPKTILGLLGAVVALFLVIFIPLEMLTEVDADEIVVKQSVFGEIDVWTTPGMHFQNFGKLTRYKKSAQFWFSDKDGDGPEKDGSIKVRFNDGGHGNISGSLSFDLPQDGKQMALLHSKYGSQAGVEHRLISQAVTQAVYMTGPLMSSKESSGERRADLSNYISDQITRGIYKTETNVKEVSDLLAGEVEVVEVVDAPDLDDAGKPKLDKDGKPLMKKIAHTVKKPRTKEVSVVEPKIEKDGTIAVQAKSTLTELGIHVYNIAISSIAYEQPVEDQIKQQQQATMAIQTAMAKSKEAEQNSLTAAKQGEAAAAKAKWDQEVKKATAVTAAEQERAVAELALATAKLQSAATIEKARGDAEARKLVMVADGALDKKLATYEAVQRAWAEAASKQPLVPQISMGGAAAGGAGTFMEAMGAKAMRDLALDLDVRSGK